MDSSFIPVRTAASSSSSPPVKVLLHAAHGHRPREPVRRHGHLLGGLRGRECFVGVPAGGGRVLQAALEGGRAAALVERPPRPDRRHRLGRGQTAPWWKEAKGFWPEATHSL